MPTKNRIGEKIYNNQGLLMEIIQYNKATDIIVRFEKSGYICKCRYGNFQKGQVYDKFFPTVCNIGYIGNANTSSNGKKKDSYKTWLNMIHRCYNDKFNAYKECFVCDEWLCYANFEKWYDENYYNINNEIMCLDKDILIKGNKIYSPNTCMFVPNKINSLFENCKKYNRENFIGICYVKEKFAYSVYCSNNNKTIYLGFFKTKEEAFLSYKEYKETHIKEIANYYKNYIPKKLYNTMMNYRVTMED